jgi:hypothetical protein
VELCRKRERFWCRVENTYPRGGLLVSINDDLLRNSDLREGMWIRIGLRHVYDVHRWPTGIDGSTSLSAPPCSGATR